MGLLAREGFWGKGSSGDGTRPGVVEGGPAADGGRPVCLEDGNVFLAQEGSRAVTTGWGARGQAWAWD